MPTDSPRFGVTFKISHYTAFYRYLIADEINAQEWKKKLGLEGVREGGGGGGGVHFQNCFDQGGYNFHMQFFFLGGGGKF